MRFAVVKFKFVILSYFLLVNFCYSQDSLSYSFINSVYQDFVSEEFTHYTLAEHPNSLLGPIPDCDLITAFSSFISKEELFKMTDTSKSISGIWNQKYLSNAICVDKDRAEKLTRGIYIWGVKNDTLSRKEIRRLAKEEANRFKKETEEIDKLPPEDKIVYYFSLPQCSSNGEYGMINMSCNGRDIGSGCIFLYHFENQKWVKKSNACCYGR